MVEAAGAAWRTLPRAYSARGKVAKSLGLHSTFLVPGSKMSSHLGGKVPLEKTPQAPGIPAFALQGVCSGCSEV